MGDDSIEVVRHDAFGFATDFPYAGYPGFFPGARVELVKIDRSEQQILKDINAGIVPNHDYWSGLDCLGVCRHHIGGEPYLVQEDTRYVIPCPVCDHPMPFLLSMGDANPDPRGFTGNAFVQVLYHLCRNCSVVSCRNDTD